MVFEPYDLYTTASTIIEYHFVSSACQPCGKIVALSVPEPGALWNRLRYGAQSANTDCDSTGNRPYRIRNQ